MHLRLLFTSYCGDVRIWNMEKFAAFGRLNCATHGPRSLLLLNYFCNLNIKLAKNFNFFAIRICLVEIEILHKILIIPLTDYTLMRIEKSNSY